MSGLGFHCSYCRALRMRPIYRRSKVTMRLLQVSVRVPS